MAVAVSNRWYFTKEQLENTPSIRAGLDPEKELSYRQQAATLIQDMGQRLSVSQLTINTAIVYMHRFYMFHCFSKFHRNVLAPCCLFLAAKIEEQPRKLEHVITVAHRCLHRGEQPLDVQSEEYMQQAQDLVENESILLQTLGFECTVHHPHTYVVKCIQLVRASKDLGQTSYFMATNSLHLTTLCLQYKPPVVACACIHLACKWSNWEIPQSSDNKNWWEYIDPTVNKELLDEIAQEFIHILDKCPSRLKKKIHSVPGGQQGKLQRAENLSSRGSGSNSSSSSCTTHTALQNNVDRAQNGVLGNDAAAHHMTSEQEKGKQREREQSMREEKERQRELKPLPSMSSSHSAAGSSISTAMVSLPPLPPLTTKYATITAPSQVPIGDPKLLLSTSGSASAGVPGKHKHHHHQSDASPAKKHKSSHSHRPRPTSQKPKPLDPVASKGAHSHKSSGHHQKHSHHHMGHHGAVPQGHSVPKPHSSHHHSLSGHKSHHGHHGHRSSSKSSADLAKRHSSSRDPHAKSKVTELPPPPPPPPPVLTNPSLPLPPSSSSSQQRFSGVSQFHRSRSMHPPGIGPLASEAAPPPPPPPGPEPMSPPPPPPPPLP